MGRDDVFSDDIDWLDVGPDSGLPETTPPRRPWPRWFTVTVIVTVLALIVGALNRERSASSRAHPPVASTTAAPSAPPVSTTVSQTQPVPSASAIAPVSVTRLGHPLLGAKTGWELFGRGDGVLVRIQPAAGRVTRTVLPALQSGGGVSMVAGSDRVVIRPLDNVPSYLVPDGKPTRVLPEPLNHGGPVFAGPVPDQMWFRPSDDHQPVMALATLDGARLASFIRLPQGVSEYDTASDGAGYLLMSGVGGVYEARPDSLRRVSTGALLATGPTGWLVVECDEQYRCDSVLIGRADGSRRVVTGGPVSRGQIGSISPDGATVAMPTPGPNGAGGLYLFDVASGRRRVVQLSVNQQFFDSNLVFSPDSAWLFAIAADGTLTVINPRTAAVSTLGVPLPTISQLVLRPAPGSA